MSSYYRGAHAVILVYDVTNRNSFSHIEQRWLEQVELYCTRGAEHCVLMLLGNKVDLVNETGKESNRAVPVEEAMALAQAHGMIFAECSSKMNLGLTEAMTSLADRLLTVSAQTGQETSSGMRLTDYSNAEDPAQGGCGC